MKEYKVKIKGKTPYMQHRMDDVALEEWEKQRGIIIERKDIHQPDEKRALFHSYMDEKGEFYIPSDQVKGSMINAGGMIKSKVGNAKKSMKNIVAAMFFIQQDKLPLNNNWVVDKRSAVNRNIKARVISIRPKWESWETEFILAVDNDTITNETIKQIIESAGNYIGIGSFRPEHNGMFGRFDLVELKQLN